ncbi:MAG: hypothetical protein ACPG32_01505 [Akkermansiaceae bacterium]
MLLSIESVPDSIGNPNPDADVRSSTWGFLVKGADSKADRSTNLRHGFSYFSGENSASTPLALGSGRRRRLVVLQGVDGGLDSAGNPIPQWEILLNTGQPNTTNMINVINSVHPAPAAQTYDAWKTANNIPTSLSGPFQDADGDGDENIKEFFFHTNPVEETENSKPVFAQAASSGHQITFRRAKNISGVEMRLAYSTDLVDWSAEIALTGSNTTVVDRGDYEEVTVALPLSGTLRFYRIELTEPSG